ncbi:MAG: ATP-binding protein, partial [Methanosarcinales archaeon]
MLNTSEILEILIDWNLWGNFKLDLLERKYYLKELESLLKTNQVIVVKGLRRAGKSSLIYLLLSKMIKKKQIMEKDTLIVNLEDPRLPILMDSKDLVKIYEVYVTELNPSEKHIVVLDEVQRIQGWERFVRYLKESKGIKVIVTGSSSKLLSSEYSTVLAGRHLDLEVFTLDFKEFLAFRGVKVKNRLEVLKKQKEIKRLLKEYLRFGGFPEVVLTKNESEKKKLLETYYRDIVIIDITTRFNIREIEKLENLTKIYISNLSTLQSFNKLKNIVNLSLDSVERFSKYLNLVRLLFFVPKFSYSLKSQILNPKKVYCHDLGFFRVIGFKFSENFGKIMENLVFLELFKKGIINPNIEIFYWKNAQGKEVDFVLK